MECTNNSQYLPWSQCHGQETREKARHTALTIASLGRTDASPRTTHIGAGVPVSTSAAARILIAPRRLRTWCAARLPPRAATVGLAETGRPLQATGAAICNFFHCKASDQRGFLPGSMLQQRCQPRCPALLSNCPSDACERLIHRTQPSYHCCEYNQWVKEREISCEAQLLPASRTRPFARSRSIIKSIC